MDRREFARDRFTLLDVVLAVQEEANDDREAVEALMNLLDPAECEGEPWSPPQANLLQGF